MDYQGYCLIGCMVFLSISDVEPLPVKMCPVNWQEFEGHCLYRPDEDPDNLCPQLDAKSVFNLFCIKEMSPLKSMEKVNLCLPDWKEFNGHCLYIPVTDTQKICSLNGAVTVFNKICVTQITEKKREEIEGNEEQLKDQLHQLHTNKEEERACCPNGFGK